MTEWAAQVMNATTQHEETLQFTMSDGVPLPQQTTIPLNATPMIPL